MVAVNVTLCAGRLGFALDAKAVVVVVTATAARS
jgi:hypothetical protein